MLFVFVFGIWFDGIVFFIDCVVGGVVYFFFSSFLKYVYVCLYFDMIGVDEGKDVVVVGLWLLKDDGCIDVM